MIRLAHLVHPVVVSPESDLTVAQPITFETMRIARDFAAGSVAVDLLATQYADEPRLPLPEGFWRTPDLERSVADQKTFRQRRKLALIRDLLDRLYENAPAADYLIYTNVDIALQPHFYRMVDQLIGQGHDALVINRRTIPGHWRDLADIPLMWAEIGETHPGWDCFVFRRDAYPRFRLGDACIGTDWIGRLMIANLASTAARFQVFGDLHLTFHIGDDRIWTNRDYADYAEHNRQECRTLLEALEREQGPLDRTRYPGRFLELVRPEAQRKPGAKLFANLILVGGPPRSGTTFMARALGSHPEVVTAIDNHVHECLGLYEYSRRTGLVAQLRGGSAGDPADLRRQLRKHLVREGALHVAPSAKDAAASLQDETLVSHRLDVKDFRPGLRLCLKSPEISFVLPQLAGLFPQARFVLVYRPLVEIAESMHRLGSTVKRLPVYQARWRREKHPPPGLPAEWSVLWVKAGDFSRCVMYAAAYLRALADGAERLGRGRCFLYDHARLRLQPRIVLEGLAGFLGIDPQGLLAAEADLKAKPRAIRLWQRLACARLERRLGLRSLPVRLDELARRPQ